MIETRRSDAELLHAWQAGDATAARVLVARYTPRLYEFFGTKVSHGAEELVQQTFADCAAAREKIEADGGKRSFRAFLFTVARRRLINHYRAWERKSAKLDPLAHSVADVDPGVSEVVARREEERRLRRALRRLPVDAQVALELHYWEGMTVAEIARVVDAAEGTIKARLSRARARLREILAEGKLADEGSVDELMSADRGAQLQL